MPEVPVQKQLSDKTFNDNDKEQKIEDLRKVIEGKLSEIYRNFLVLRLRNMNEVSNIAKFRKSSKIFGNRDHQQKQLLMTQSKKNRTKALRQRLKLCFI